MEKQHWFSIAATTIFIALKVVGVLNIHWAWGLVPAIPIIWIGLCHLVAEAAFKNL